MENFWWKIKHSYFFRLFLSSSSRTKCFIIATHLYHFFSTLLFSSLLFSSLLFYSLPLFYTPFVDLLSPLLPYSLPKQLHYSFCECHCHCLLLHTIWFLSLLLHFPIILFCPIFLSFYFIFFLVGWEDSERSGRLSF